MKYVKTLTCGIALLILTTVFIDIARTGDREKLLNADWPQWRGPNRDGKSLETGLIKKFSKDGPDVLWQRQIGTGGYSGIAIAQGFVYTMYSEGDHEYAICLDSERGTQVWLFLADNIFLNEHGRGPRSTPVVDGNRVYILSAKGFLYCLKAKEKKKIWRVDLGQCFGGQTPRWGFSCSPIIAGDLLLVEIGSTTRNIITAFNKYDGKIEWKTYTDAGSYIDNHASFGIDKPGYSSPISLAYQRSQQILFFTSSQLLSIAPSGEIYWRFPWQTRYGANVATPVFIPDNKIFISSGYNKGCALLQMKPENNSKGVEVVWQNKVMRNSFATAIYHENCLYGFDKRTLKCIDVATGKERWKKSGFGYGNLIYADGQLIVLSEKGDIALVEPNPQKYKEKSKARVLSRGKCWSAPSLANGHLFLRNQFEIICLKFSE